MKLSRGRWRQCAGSPSLAAAAGETGLPGAAGPLGLAAAAAGAAVLGLSQECSTPRERGNQCLC